MSDNCDQSCGSCSAECSERRATEDFTERPHELSHIRRVIGVVSGKGGVGKSLVTSTLATLMRRKGYRTAILDADITGPSIPKAFGIRQRALADQTGLLPIKSRTGIEIMSINLLLENDTDPVIWRGPILAGTVKQFWKDVVWGDVDYMFIDMPPGTGDVPLTVFQSIAVDGIIIVTSPQELVSMIVSKAVRMAQMMNVPVLGLVENMSYFRCPDNGKDYRIFGESHIEDVAAAHGLEVLARIPIDPRLAEACDSGRVESFDGDWLDPVARVLEGVKGKDG
ncbi:Mrp/NBP35 family ATP-binding protein [Methanomassiliicoccus luminyensis]|uniref:Mrp/NBP35 family ATP-binding protein n=1 Tax=Methanomassiliicoccus luminyensis TaxID=1080712 RepID=UPI000376EFA8|nr:Mrp/NBP35 family ATP-binding protein [Methanomassiliicoccus luminyensis]